VIDWIGFWNVRAAVSGPSCVTVSVRMRVTRSGSANSPTSETMIRSAGKIDSIA
jgi:hypothetical protein